MTMQQIDLHSHILPGLDHGSRNLETSLQQLKLISEGGTEIVAATSHFYPARMNMEDFRRHRNASVRALQAALTDAHPKIVLGAEVACYPGLHHMEGLEELCFAGTNCLLLEMPLAKWSDSLFETVEGILDRGIRVILAHIDRYESGDVEDIMQLDVVAQINASSLCSFFRRRKLMHWFEEDRVWALGSDLHGSDVGSYDHFPKALGKLGREAVDGVMVHTASLLENAEFLSKTKVYT